MKLILTEKNSNREKNCMNKNIFNSEILLIIKNDYLYRDRK